MILQPPRSTRTDTLFPYPPLCPSHSLRFRLRRAAIAARSCSLCRSRAGPIFVLRRGRLRRQRLTGLGRSEAAAEGDRSKEHTSELQSLMRISYAVFCLKKKKTKKQQIHNTHQQHDAYIIYVT